MLLNDIPNYQRVLLLQGPIGPFFRRLARFLEERGTDVFKINFNAGNKPEYTAAAARAEIQCTVTVAYTMETNGSIEDAHVERSCGPSREHKQLDRATLDAVRAVKGTPGTVDGKPEKLTGDPCVR